MRRMGKGKYLRFVAAENAAFYLNQSFPNITVNVLCPGVIYGTADSPFNELLRYCWLQNPDTLQYIGSGENELPTIHVNDLITHVKYLLLEDTQKLKYVFAVDDNRKRRQRQIVKAMAVKINKQRIQSVVREACFYSETLRECLTLDLPCKLSTLFLQHELRLKVAAEAEAEAAGAPADDVSEDAGQTEQKPQKLKPAALEYAWHCKEGPVKGIALLRDEYVKGEKLVPIRVCVIGGPYTGKSHLAAKLAAKYNVPHLTKKSVIEYFRQAKGKLSEDIKAMEEELRETQFQQLLDEYELAKRRGKANLKRPPVKESLTVKLPERYLLYLVSQRLLVNDCANRGYILDGFPDSYKSACKLFKSCVMRLSAPASEIA